MLLSSLFLCTNVSAQVMDPAITQENIKETICSGKPEWNTSHRRPPVSYTNKYKFAFLQSRGLPKSAAPLYELDHIEAIENGGHPRDPKNFQLQAWKGTRNAHEKDVEENAWHKKICSGEKTLQEAQEYFAKNWIVK